MASFWEFSWEEMAHREVRMRKSNIFTGCLYFLLMAALLWLIFVEANPTKDKLYSDLGGWLGQNFLADPAVAEAVTERRLALERFRAATNKVEGALVAGELTLADAVERILAAWDEEFAELGVQIAEFEEGATAQERLARSIVKQVDDNEQLRQNRELRERLQAQLADLLKKRPKTPQPGLVVSMA